VPMAGKLAPTIGGVDSAAGQPFQRL